MAAIDKASLGIVRVKNETGAPYAFDEIPGYTLPDGQEVNLLAVDDVTKEPLYYGGYRDVMNLIDNCPDAELCKDIADQTPPMSGLTVSETVEPLRKP